MADNASDNKKQYAFSLHALMVAVDLFVTVTSGFFRTGHSHDDQDAMFGGMESISGRTKDIGRSARLRQCIAAELPRHAFRIFEPREKLVRLRFGNTRATYWHGRLDYIEQRPCIFLLQTVGGTIRIWHSRFAVPGTASRRRCGIIRSTVFAHD